MNSSNNKSALNGGEGGVSSNKKVCTSYDQKFDNCNDGASCATNSIQTCASCGSTGDNLKTCTGCNSVKYCNVECQKQHRPHHKKECRRIASSREKTSISDNLVRGINSMMISDDDLFKDPLPKEDCPICMLPMPYGICLGGVQGSYASYQPCCGKMICSGCMLASINEINKGKMKDACAFCRVPIRRTSEEFMERCEKRMQSNDAEAFKALGDYKVGGPSPTPGGPNLPRDMKRALELWYRGAELDSCRAHQALASTYYHGDGVEKNMEKAMYHFKQAAMRGHEGSRQSLGAIEIENGNFLKAMKHFMIAASSGCDRSLKSVGIGYKKGYVTKDDYARTLRDYQHQVNEMKSEQRSMAADHWAEVYGSKGM